MKKGNMKQERKIALLYVGKNEFFPGMPARDLYEDELEKRGGKQVLLGTGLYKEPETKAKPEVK